MTTYIKVQPEDEHEMAKDIDDTESNEDIPLQRQEELRTVVSEDSDHSMPYTDHTQNSQWQ